jgi:hypothetical protein
VSAFLAEAPRLVGHFVLIEGACFGYGNAAALGPPPITRSDWAFGDDGPQLYVVGTMPVGCTAVSPRGTAVRTALLAMVAEDTLRALGASHGTARRYLKVVRTP